MQVKEGGFTLELVKSLLQTNHTRINIHTVGQEAATKCMLEEIMRMVQMDMMAT